MNAGKIGKVMYMQHTLFFFLIVKQVGPDFQLADAQMPLYASFTLAE